MTRLQAATTVIRYHPRPGDGWLTLVAAAVVAWDLYWLVGCWW